MKVYIVSTVPAVKNNDNYPQGVYSSKSKALNAIQTSSGKNHYIIKELDIDDLFAHFLGQTMPADNQI